MLQDVVSPTLGDWCVCCSAWQHSKVLKCTLRLCCRFPVLLFALFNWADLVGKSLPMWGALVVSEHASILQLAFARTAFVPAFWLASWLGAGPWLVCLLAVLLGVSNGWVTALAMMAGPVGLLGPEAAMSGQIMVFCLVLGLCLGAGCGFLWLL